jgi:hypothetical protein
MIAQLGGAAGLSGGEICGDGHSGSGERGKVEELHVIGCHRIAVNLRTVEPKVLKGMLYLYVVFRDSQG